MADVEQVRERRPLKILLVEDSPLLRTRLVGMLSQHGTMMVVGQAAAEKEAIEKLNVVPFDALVVDVELRPGSGIEVIRRMRASGSRPLGERRIPIIVLTNYDLPAVRERCLHAGADFFLDKMREIERLVPLLLEIAQQTDATVQPPFGNPIPGPAQ